MQSDKDLLEARKRLILADSVAISPHFQTLFNGLKLNHPENVAMVHPLFFMLRRVLYAAVIVGLARYGALGAILVQVACLVQLCLLCSFWSWSDPLINAQHLGSEIALHMILSL